MLAGARKPDSSDSSDPAPPVRAGRLSSVGFVKKTFKEGANINFRLQEGSPPFLFAADRGDIPLMRLLLQLGADPPIPKVDGTTPRFTVEVYTTRLPRLDAPTVAAITRLMLAAGISTEDTRPKMIDSYETPAVRPTPPAPPK